MVSTPLVRGNNQENTNSVMRKQLIGSARKAFQDRSVNRVSKVLKTPINKPQLNLLQVLKSPDVRPEEKELPTWMTSMSIKSPKNDIRMFEFNSKIFMENLYARPPTPTPEPISDFAYDLEFISSPPTIDYNFHEFALNLPESPPYDFMMDSNIECVLEKPHTNFDY